MLYQLIYMRNLTLIEDCLEHVVDLKCFKS
jgi:hypothetical protein